VSFLSLQSKAAVPVNRRVGLIGSKQKNPIRREVRSLRRDRAIAISDASTSLAAGLRLDRVHAGGIVLHAIDVSTSMSLTSASDTALSGTDNVCLAEH
jgi:hypothetical protein